MAKAPTVVPDSQVSRNMETLQAAPSKSGKGNPLYALYLVNLETGSIERRFGFDVPPQTMRLREEGASDVAAQQDGGFYSDERGQYFKILSVSGTFGYRPTPIRTEGAFPGVNKSLDQIQRAVNRQNTNTISNPAIPFSEVTGFNRYQSLHNIFRFYWDMKKQRGSAGNYIMIWADWKMGEVYFCQPMTFDRDRSIPSGKTRINYSFSLRWLDPVEITKPPDFLESPNSVSGQGGFLQSMKDAAKFLQAANQLLLESSTAAIDYGFDVVTTIYRPIDEALGFVDVTIKSVAQAAQKTLSVAQLTIQSLRNVHRACLQAAPIAYASSGFTKFGHNYMLAARMVQQTFITMISAIAKTDVNIEAREIGGRYRKWDSDAALTPDDPVSGEQIYGDRGSKTSLGSRKIPVGFRSIKIPSRTSIKALALKYLGSAGRWKEIVILNNLKAPYISPKGDGLSVLRPGQNMKIPANLVDVDIDENQVFNPLGEEVDSDAYRYGRDLRINEDTKQLVVGSGGDYETIEGLDNLEQAAKIKIWRTPGELKAHPWFGFGARAGQGVAADVLAGYHLQLRMSLLSDTRIREIKSMTMQVAGDILMIGVKCVTKDNDNTILLATRKNVR